jgi:hypothetical protein
LNAANIVRNLLLLPFPEFGSVTEQYSSIGSAPYNALQVQVTKPMRHHVSLQGNLTWDKLMLHTAYIDNYAAAIGKLESVQDGQPTLFGNIFGVVELPKFQSRPYYQRLILGGWQLNSVVRFSNGPLVGAPGNVDIIGNYVQPHQTLARAFNTCYQSTSIVNNAVVVTQVNTTPTAGLPTSTACDAQSPSPAFRQRIQYTSQSNSNVLNIRYPNFPLVDASMFKKFIIREGMSFEIRGEFFNILNTPEFGPPNTTLVASNAGSAGPTNGIFSQTNDARIGQLTARFNF